MVAKAKRQNCLCFFTTQLGFETRPDRSLCCAHAESKLCQPYVFSLISAAHSSHRLLVMSGSLSPTVWQVKLVFALVI